MQTPGATVREHPNASLAAAVSGITVTGWTIAQQAFGVRLDEIMVATITGGVITLALVIGKRGLRGLCLIVWRGNDC